MKLYRNPRRSKLKRRETSIRISVVRYCRHRGSWQLGWELMGRRPSSLSDEGGVRAAQHAVW